MQLERIKYICENCKSEEMKLPEPYSSWTECDICGCRAYEEGYRQEKAPIQFIGRNC